MTSRAQTLQLTYCKTPLGQQAIAARSVPLLAAERRVLILIDGERNVAQLYQQLHHQDVLGLIASLEKQGLIRNLAASQAAIPIPVEPPRQAESAVLLDAEELMAVKSLMISSSKQGLGLLAARLVREIEEVNDAHSLKATMARWNMALRESRSVAAQADHLLQMAKAMLPGAA